MGQRLSYIRIIVDDFTASFDFYNNILELPLKYGGKEDEYCEFETGNTDIAIFSRVALNASTGLKTKSLTEMQANVMIIIQVENLDASYTHLKEAGVEILTEPTIREEWDVKTLHIKDPDGNLVEINTRLDG